MWTRRILLATAIAGSLLITAGILMHPESDLLPHATPETPTAPSNELVATTNDTSNDRSILHDTPTEPEQDHETQRHDGRTPILELLKQLEAECSPNEDRKELESLIHKLKWHFGDEPDFNLMLTYATDTSKDAFFRWVLIDALGFYRRQLRNKDDAIEVISRLSVVLKDKNDSPLVRDAVIARLTTIILRSVNNGYVDDLTRERHSQSLLAIVNDHTENAEVLRSAVSALGRLREQRAVTAFLEFIAHNNDVDLTRCAVSALGKTAPIEHMRVLLDLLDRTEDRSLRGTVIYTLGQIGTVDIISPIVKNYHRDPDSCHNALVLNEDMLINIVAGEQPGQMVDSVMALGLIQSSKAIATLMMQLGKHGSVMDIEVLVALGRIDRELLKNIRNDVPLDEDIFRKVYRRLEGG